jgi:hypothetical protein
MAAPYVSDTISREVAGTQRRACPNDRLEHAMRNGLERNQIAPGEFHY